ncbi:MAG: polymer-forming cytoskeletal protein [Haliea sp.]|uniref:bactofilin family protein n=1 Tax=Haliea sp. TaxID=1932666 RepID=UPI0032EE02C2
MLGSKRRGAMVAGGTTLVSRETTINGDLHFSGNLEIEGVVKGSVIADAGKEAMVRVVAAGCVEGEIRAPIVMINGTVEGCVHASRHLELAPCARVSGDVHYSIVEMAAGAEINGRMLHSSESELTAPGQAAEPQLRVASVLRSAGGAIPTEALSAKAPPAKAPPAKVD